MDISTLQTFFMWMTIINFGLLVFILLITTYAADWVYKTHSRFFPISREAFNVAMYGFNGFFRILFLIFNLVPFIALAIVG